MIKLKKKNSELFVTWNTQQANWRMLFLLVNSGIVIVMESPFEGETFKVDLDKNCPL